MTIAAPSTGDRSTKRGRAALSGAGALARENDIYPVTCVRCAQSGTLEFWREERRWGVVWKGFRGHEVLISMPRRARAACLGCKGRLIRIGERLDSTAA